MQTPARAAGTQRLDPALLMAAPAALFMLAVFVYPFLNGLFLSFHPL